SVRSYTSFVRSYVSFVRSYVSFVRSYVSSVRSRRGHAVLLHSCLNGCFIPYIYRPPKKQPYPWGPKASLTIRIGFPDHPIEFICQRLNPRLGLPTPDSRLPTPDSRLKTHEQPPPHPRYPTMCYHTALDTDAA